MNTPIRFGFKLSAPAVLLAVLTGCAVTPQPIDMAQSKAALGAERTALYQNQEAVKGPISLDEAIARSLKYNLDYRLKLMEEALAQRQLDLSQADLLPRLSAQAGYTTRNNDNASFSRNVATGAVSLVPSISSDRNHSAQDLGLSWNVLDFGVSYYQSQQQADRFLVAQERRRKAIHLVMQQVRLAYWQAVGAQQLEAKILPLMAQTREALGFSRKIEAERLQAPLEVLNYQRQLLDLMRQLEAVRDELSQARPRLAALLNMEPGKSFELVVPSALAMPDLAMSLEKMEETALLGRPELMEARYNERIGALETRKAVARLFPGVEFFIGTHYDGNSYLTNSQWRDAGMRVSWNLLNVLNYKTILGTAEAQQEVAKSQRLALSMAVLTQVHVAYRDYLGRKRQYELNQELDGVEQRILTLTKSAVGSEAQGKLNEIRVTAGALLSQLRLFQSYGAMQGTYGQMLATLGWDSLPSMLPSHDLATVTKAVAQMDATWAKQLGTK